MCVVGVMMFIGGRRVGNNDDGGGGSVRVERMNTWTRETKYGRTVSKVSSLSASKYMVEISSFFTS